MKKINSLFVSFVIVLGFLTVVAGVPTGCSGGGSTTDTVAQDSTPPLNGTFFTLSDVHFNPFFDPALVDQLMQTDVTGWAAIFRSSQVQGYGAYGEDSNYQLMTSAFAAMKGVKADPDFIIITGDFLGHNFQADFQKYTGISDSSSNYTPAVDGFITKTIQFIAMELAEQFPNTLFYPVLGNNDDFCGDYMIEPNDPFLPMFAETWAPYFDSANRVSLMKTFPTEGYYTASLPGHPEHVIVGMNTMYFSKKNKSTCMPDDPTSGPDEITWLTQTLQSCQQNNQKVWFTCHIPPGAEVRSGVSGLEAPASCTDSIKMMWKDGYDSSFIGLERQYSGIINGGIGGHTHMDEFRLINDINGSPISFFHINPSISPIDGNNPGFNLFTYDPTTMTMLGYTSHVFHGIEPGGSATWTLQYDFGQTYGVQEITGATMGSVYNALETDTTLQNDYMNYFCGGGSEARPVKWLPYWCCIGCTEKTTFSNCVCQPMK